MRLDQTDKGLKIYDGDVHVKTVRMCYLGVVSGGDLSWIKSKTIRPSKEEQFYLEYKYNLQDTESMNAPTKKLLSTSQIRSVKKIIPRSAEPYYVAVNSDGVEIKCAPRLFNCARKLGMDIEVVKRLV